MKEQRIIGAGLALMSFSSGCVDILSYRFLGQVFTSAMTGNVALMGLDLGQGNLGAASRNMTAFIGFLIGLIAAALIFRGGTGRRRLIAAAVLEAALLAWFAAEWHLRGAEALLYGLIGGSAIAMGIQSAIAHRIGMPGITTTYFTGTITSIVLGLIGARQPNVRRAAWPAVAFLSYVLGAVMAGWYSSGRDVPELPTVLPFIPAAAAAALAILIALARE